MDSSHLIEDALQRPRHYWTADGIPEIAIGIFWLTWGAAILAPVIAPNQFLVRMGSVLVIAVVGASAIALPRIILWWKERVTFPRTGYVELKKPATGVRFAIGALAVTAGMAIAAFAVVGTRSIRGSIPLLLGVLVSALLVQIARKVHSARLTIMSPLVAVVAIGATVVRAGEDLATGVVLLSAGIVCLLDGVAVLRSYLHAHPRPAETGHE